MSRESKPKAGPFASPIATVASPSTAIGVGVGGRSASTKAMSKPSTPMTRVDAGQDPLSLLSSAHHEEQAQAKQAEADPAPDSSPAPSGVALGAADLGMGAAAAQGEGQASASAALASRGAPKGLSPLTRAAATSGPHRSASGRQLPVVRAAPAAVMGHATPGTVASSPATSSPGAGTRPRPTSAASAPGLEQHAALAKAATPGPAAAASPGGSPTHRQREPRPLSQGGRVATPATAAAAASRPHAATAGHARSLSATMAPPRAPPAAAATASVTLDDYVRDFMENSPAERPAHPAPAATMQGLRSLVADGRWRAAAELASSLLNAHSPPPHDLPPRLGAAEARRWYSLKYWRLASLMRQRLTAHAIREAAVLGSLVLPKESSFEADGGWQAPLRGMAAFKRGALGMPLRALLCELPFHQGAFDSAIQALSALDRLLQSPVGPTADHADGDLGMLVGGSDDLLQTADEDEADVVPDGASSGAPLVDPAVRWRMRLLRRQCDLMASANQPQAALGVCHTILSLLAGASGASIDDCVHTLGLVVRLRIHVGAVESARRGLAALRGVLSDRDDLSHAQLYEGLLVAAEGQYDAARRCFARVICHLCRCKAPDDADDSVGELALPRDWWHFKCDGRMNRVLVDAAVNFAVCTVHCGNLQAAINTLEDLIRGDPAGRATREVLFNVCTLYDLAFDPHGSRRRKMVLRHLAEQFGVHLHSTAYRL